MESGDVRRFRRQAGKENRLETLDPVLREISNSGAAPKHLKVLEDYFFT
jgi:hypothetical protein